MNKLTAILLIFWVSSCSKSDKGNNKNNSSEPNDDASLVGEWLSECVIDGDIAVRAILDLSSEKSILQLKGFSDKNCEEKDDLGHVKVYGTYAAEKKDAKDQYPTTFKHSKTTVTVASDGMAALLNAGKTCGVTNWKANTEIDVPAGSKECLPVDFLKESQKDIKMKIEKKSEDHILIYPPSDWGMGEGKHFSFKRQK